MKLLALFLLLSLVACKDEKDGPYATYDNLGCIIMDMNNGDGEYSSGKHHNIPTTIKIVLIYAPRIRLYAELDSREMPSIITDQWYYNHKVGDSIHFDYILRSRFFPINR